mgnify:CR=1 FL=1
MERNEKETNSEKDVKELEVGEKEKEETKRSRVTGGEKGEGKSKKKMEE